MAKDLVHYFLESPTRGFINIVGFSTGNFKVIVGATSPTFFKSKEKCEDFQKAFSHLVVDLEVRDTKGMEEWWVELLERFEI